MKTGVAKAQKRRDSKSFRIMAVMAGGLLAAVGLELFLMPHGLVVGGITGLSALFAHTTEMRLGLFLFLFNLPFIFMSRKQINLRFALYTVLGLTCLTVGSLALHQFPAIIGDPLPAAIGGGICLGLGVGISVRFGGMNREDNASDQGYSLLSGGPPRSSEFMIMLLNCAILFAAGALFGWDQAMYSIIAYLLAFEGVRLSLRGLTPSRSAWITSSRCEEIQQVLKDQLNREAALIGESGRDGLTGTLFCLTDKTEQAQLAAIVRRSDPDCRIVFKSAESYRRRRIIFK
jgi:uncharacterized membrane-anchored protein YitT (DUF2179 family)